MIMIGFLLAALYAMARAKEFNSDGDTIADLLILEHLNTGAQTVDNAASYRLGRLFEDCVGRFRRMGCGENIKECVEFLF